MESAGNLKRAFRHVVITVLSTFLSDFFLSSWLIASGVMDVFIVSLEVPAGWWQSKG